MEIVIGDKLENVLTGSKYLIVNAGHDNEGDWYHGKRLNTKEKGDVRVLGNLNPYMWHKI